tara:strand:+ start:177 stop:356 length:180 start_codon:yes stop_codon:yes gene_type:complete
LFNHFSVLFFNMFADNRLQKSPLTAMSGRKILRRGSSFPAFAGWIWHLVIETRCFNRLP